MIKFCTLITLLIFSINSYSQILTEDQAVEDLQILYSSIQNVHPDLFWDKSKDISDSDFTVLLEKVKTEIDKEEFYKLTAEFVAGFNSSHLAVTLPLLTLGDFSKSDKLKPLPLELYFTSRGLFVKDNIIGKGKIKRGDRVLEINGNSVDLILDNFQKLDKSVRNFDVWNYYSKFFMEYYRMQFGDTNTFMFKYVDFETNDTLSQTLNSISVDTWGEYFMANFPKEKFRFDLHEKQKMGVIKITTFADLSGFDSFLESTFKEIKKTQIEHLIIDIRDNEGGNTQYVDELLNYATTKPYKYEDYYVGKVSQERRDEIMKIASNYPVEQHGELLKTYKLNWLFDNEVGDSVIFSGEQLLHHPKDLEDKFDGKLYLLVNERVGSTSHMFCQAFKCSDLGQVIGQETGEATIFFGDNCAIELPNSKLKISIATKKFVSHCEAFTTKGLIPDYSVDFSPSKLLNGEDEVLDYTINLIAK